MCFRSVLFPQPEPPSMTNISPLIDFERNIVDDYDVPVFRRKIL